MSGVTKGQLATQNAELLEAVKKLQKMNEEAMALARRARNDADDVERASVKFKEQRDRLIGFVQGYRRDIEHPIGGAGAGGAMMAREPIVEISRVDAFLGECREDPEPINTAQRRRL